MGTTVMFGRKDAISISGSLLSIKIIFPSCTKYFSLAVVKLWYGFV